VRVIILITAFAGCQTQKKNIDKAEQQIEAVQSEAVVNNSTNDTLWIDLNKTQINWVGRKVTGEHSGTVHLSKGWVIMEDDIFKSGQLIFDMKSIQNTDIESPKWKLKLENHLKNNDFFAVDSFPQAILNISGSQALSQENSENNHQIMADLTIRGITQEISFPILIHKSGSIFSAEGNMDINRTLYNIHYKSGKFFADLGDKMIYDIFTVQFLVHIHTKLMQKN